MFPLVAIAAPLVSQMAGSVAKEVLPGPVGEVASTALSLANPTSLLSSMSSGLLGLVGGKAGALL
ncbi:hypothetical protein J2W35_004181 [Variovorax boronicumulans]|uniref:hypothetical protein n=1 Tax=Variovorax boronicumulans TaxID=436515 RepID=UPI0027871161|nr:hypothetical protein [Variovorax boronicumulans]MDQ0083815.1 hypothetical protein [Variovorax boronicumulans]